MHCITSAATHGGPGSISKMSVSICVLKSWNGLGSGQWIQRVCTEPTCWSFREERETNADDRKTNADHLLTIWQAFRKEMLGCTQKSSSYDRKENSSKNQGFLGGVPEDQNCLMTIWYPDVICCRRPIISNFLPSLSLMVITIAITRCFLFVRNQSKGFKHCYMDKEIEIMTPAPESVPKHFPIFIFLRRQAAVNQIGQEESSCHPIFCFILKVLKVYKASFTKNISPWIPQKEGSPMPSCWPQILSSKGGSAEADASRAHLTLSTVGSARKALKSSCHSSAEPLAPPSFVNRELNYSGSLQGGHLLG